jgi:hypothetical protein
MIIVLAFFVIVVGVIGSLLCLALDVKNKGSDLHHFPFRVW